MWIKHWRVHLHQCTGCALQSLKPIATPRQWRDWYHPLLYRLQSTWLVRFSVQMDYKVHQPFRRLKRCPANRKHRLVGFPFTSSLKHSIVCFLPTIVIFLFLLICIVYQWHWWTEIIIKIAIGHYTQSTNPSHHRLQWLRGRACTETSMKKNYTMNTFTRLKETNCERTTRVSTGWGVKWVAALPKRPGTRSWASSKSDENCEHS